MTAPREPVAIFWDLENCQLPSTAGLSAVDNIRSIAQSYGFVKLFKAYLDVAEQNSPKTSILRSELQSCGVTVTDCPHSNRKDVADKMMIVDMIVFAMDDLPPATVIILSGDRDFVYAASTLRLRAYHVVVIGPKTCHHQYQGRASEVLDWDVAVLSKQGTLTRGRHYSISTASPTTDVSALERSSKSTNVPLPTPKPSRRSSFRDDRSPPSPRVPSTYAKSQGPAGVVTTSSAHQDHLVPEIDIEVATPPNECVLQDSDRHLLLAVEGGQADDEVESSTLSPLDIPPNTMSHSSDSGSPDSQNSSHSGTFTEANELSQHAVIDECETDVPTAHLLQAQVTATTQLSHSHSRPRSGSAPCRVSQPSTTGSTVSCTFLTVPTDTNQPFRSRTDVQSAPTDLSQLTSRTFTLPANTTLSRLDTQLKVTTRDEEPELHVLDHFLPMIDILNQEQDHQMLRSKLASRLLAQYNGVYEAANVRNWKEYAQLAKRHGIIELGGTEGKAYASLHPAWHGHGQQ